MSVKGLVRLAQTQKRRKKQADSEAASGRVKQAHQTLLACARAQVDKVKRTLAVVSQSHPDVRRQQEIQDFIAHAERQIDPIERRVIYGEVIPHDEKVFSLFQLEDEHGFILHHRVMSGETDDKVAVAMMKDAQQKFPALRACSFDKGFHSPANQQQLGTLLDQAVLPRKGKLSKERQAIEHSAAFKQARRRHSAVESAINALEVHGLDTCHDHGIDGFKRYVALAVVARNLYRLGDILWQQDKAREKRRQAAQRGGQNKRAA